MLGLSIAASPSFAETIHVRAGSNLQAALNAAQPGDVLLLQAGATFSGNFTLPVKPGAAHITIRTSTSDDRLPAAGARITPGHAPLLARIQSPNTAPALRTAAGAHHWRLQLLEFGPNAHGSGDILQIGDGSSAQYRLSQVPYEIDVDRVYLHGDPAAGQKRGIALNGRSVTIRNSYIADIKAVGQDSQAIGGWNGPGPYTIENNYLEAAGENVLIGGADPAIPNLVAEGVVFRRNHVAKPLAWRGQAWQVKNLFELKNARRVTVEYNVFENNWRQAQPGYAILFTPRNQDGGCPWCVVEDVTFQYNVVRNTGGGINLTGYDDLSPSAQTANIRIRHNLFYGLTREAGTGWFMLIGNQPRDITITHNTIDHDGTTVLYAHGGTATSPERIIGFEFSNNAARHNAYGINGAGASSGSLAISMYFPDGFIRGNWLAGGSASRYPVGNLFAGAYETAFVGAGASDYRLSADSVLRSRATDGSNIGADMPALLAGVSGVAEGEGRAPVVARVSNPQGWIDTPTNGATVGKSFVIAGWAIDAGAANGPGVDAIHVYAFPASGSPIFLGAASYGGARPDIGAIFGSPFTGSGFGLNAAGLAPGAYTITVFYRSTLTGVFASAARRVTVRAPASDPLMALDTPASGAAVSGQFLLAGWAIDRDAPAGCGVGTVHAWAFPVGGGSPIFAGAATPEGARPDLGAIFGQQFAACGYNLVVGPLPAGTYDLVAYAHSTATGTFNQQRGARVTVR